MASLKTWPTGFSTRSIPVIQGDYNVSGDQNIVLSTILGSCASVCLYDKVAGVGGLNHYLLATASKSDMASLKYGANAMELLINKLLRSGALRIRLEAKIFGGARMTGRFDDIGARNTEFASSFLRDENIPIVDLDVGGTLARRINFHPYSGQTRVFFASAEDEIRQSGRFDSQSIKADPRRNESILF